MRRDSQPLLGSLFEDEPEHAPVPTPSVASVAFIPLWVKIPRHEWQVLKPGIYACSPIEFRTRLVDEFPGSERRGEIYQGFQRLRGYLAGYGLTGWYWVSGSFVTTKPDPVDLDVTAFVHHETLERGSAETQLFLRALLKDANEARRRFLCDTDLIPVFPQGDPQHDRYLRAREKKQAAYGRTNPEKTGVAAPRGFLQLPLEGDYPDLPSVRDRDEKATPEMVERDWAYDDSTLLREELEEVRQTRQELEQSGDTRFSVRLWLDSLAAQESRLVRRLRAIEFLEVAGTDQDGEILWEGAAAANQRMDFGVLAELLRNIQTIVKRLTPSQSFTLQAGVPQPGSFRIPFYLVPEAEAETGQATLLEIDPENPADLFAQMLDDDATHDQISSHLTNDTVRRSYVQVMKHVAANGLVMEFRTRHLPGGGVLTPKHATERQVWFDDSHTKVENIVLTGELQTGTIVAGSCKILSSNGEKPYTLRIDKARALQLRGIPLAALVRASVERITTTHPDFDRPRIVHRLTHIERLDTPGLFG